MNKLRFYIFDIQENIPCQYLWASLQVLPALQPDEPISTFLAITQAENNNSNNNRTRNEVLHSHRFPVFLKIVLIPVVGWLVTICKLFKS